MAAPRPVKVGPKKPENLFSRICRSLPAIRFDLAQDKKEAQITPMVEAILQAQNLELPESQRRSPAVLRITTKMLSVSISRLPFWWAQVSDQNGVLRDTITLLNDTSLGEGRPVEWIIRFIYPPNPRVSLNNIMILKAATGSGKSTMIPTSFLLNGNFSRKMYITQPRRFNATSISSGVSQMTGCFRYRRLPAKEKEDAVVTRWKSGLPKDDEPYPETSPLDEKMIDMNPNLIGYMTGDKKRGRNAKVVFVTEGLMAHLIRKAPEKYLGPECVIVIDEVHERNIETDQLIFEIFQYLESLRMASRSLPDFRLIIMSATFTPQEFSDYFSYPVADSMGTFAPLVDPSRIVVRDIKGTAARVHTHFLGMPVPDVARAAAERVTRIHAKDPGRSVSARDGKIMRDIIVFVPGEEMSQRIQRYLGRLIPTMPDNGVMMTRKEILSKVRYPELEPALIINVNAQMTDTEITKRPLQSFGNGSARRRIFFATDFAETGITFTQLKFVVDTGLRNSVTFDPLNGIRVMALTPISQNSARQRKGRVGRTGEGYCYHLFMEADFLALQPDTPAKILTDPRVTEMCMRFISEGVLPSERHLLTHVTPEQEMYSLGLLWSLGMIRIVGPGSTDGSLAFLQEPTATQLGEDYLEIVRVGGPEFGKCILAAAALDPSVIYPLVVAIQVYGKLASKGKFPAFVPLDGDPATTRVFRSDYLNYYEFFRQYNRVVRLPRQQREDWESHNRMRGLSSMDPADFKYPSVDVMESLVYDIDKIWGRIRLAGGIGGLAESHRYEGALSADQQLAVCRSIISGFHYNRAHIHACRDYYQCNNRGGTLFKAASIYANNGVDSPNPHQAHRAHHIVFTGLEWRPALEYPVATGVTVLDRLSSGRTIQGR